jgi:hypothetical protein
MWSMQEIDMPPGRPRHGESASGYGYAEERRRDWTVYQMRRDFLMMSPAAQEAYLQRVIDLLHAERVRQQRSPSALRQLADKVYGVQE